MYSCEHGNNCTVITIDGICPLCEAHNDRDQARKELEDCQAQIMELEAKIKEMEAK